MHKTFRLIFANFKHRHLISTEQKAIKTKKKGYFFKGGCAAVPFLRLLNNSATLWSVKVAYLRQINYLPTSHKKSAQWALNKKHKRVSHDRLTTA